jgi:SprT-like family
VKYLLTNEEWGRTHSALGCTVDNGIARAAAQAGLYKLTHRHSASYRTFNWKALPSELGLAGVTANRYFVRWNRSGEWLAFWDALIVLRCGLATALPRPLPKSDDPIRNALDEIQRAYAFLNHRFTGGELPEAVAFTIEKSSGKNASLGAYSVHKWSTPGATNSSSFHHIALMTGALKGGQCALGVLLHEMAHLHNWIHGVKDTNPRTQYHTQDFRDVAVLFGLQCGTRDAAMGFYKTSLNQRGLEAIQLLNTDDESLWMRWVEPSGSL